MADELHIASLVVYCTPARLPPVAQRLGLIAGCVVHATGAAGQMVLTLEAASAERVAETVARIQQLDGVLSAQLVYQCGDSLAAMNEEIPDGETGVR